MMIIGDKSIVEIVISRYCIEGIEEEKKSRVTLMAEIGTAVFQVSTSNTEVSSSTNEHDNDERVSHEYEVPSNFSRC